LSHCRIDPVEVAQNKGGGARSSQNRKRIDDLNRQVDSRNSSGSSDLGGLARRLTRRCRRTICHAHRRIGVGECKKHMHVEIAKCDSPI
jgi:hypothetical protein